MNQNEGLKPPVQYTCAGAIRFYDLTSEPGDRSHVLMAEEFRSMLRLIDTLFDERGDLKGPFAYGLVKRSIQRYHDDLRQDYPVMAYEVGLLLDRLDDLEDSFLRLEYTGACRVPRCRRDVGRPDDGPDAWVMALASLAAQSKATRAGSAQNDPARAAYRSSE